MRKKKELGRILLLAGLYHPMIGGYIRVLDELVKRFENMGYTIDVLTCNTSNSPPYETHGHINVIRLDSRAIINGLYPVPIINYNNYITIKNISEKNYSLIITNTRFYPVCLIGWMLSFLRSTPHIHFEHGSRHTVSDTGSIAIIGQIYDHVIGSILVKSADISFGVSEVAAKFLNHLGAKNARVMHNGVDFSYFNQRLEDDGFKQQSSISIAYVGRLVYAKGVQDLISIYPELEGNVRLIIVGDGPYRHELEEIANRFPNANIEFMGEKLPEDIPSILSRTDVFVNPSYSEGLPTSVLEACAAGCAVVATDVGGTSEIIQDRQTGILVAPGNQHELAQNINLLIRDKTFREKLGTSAKSYVMDRFSWEHIMGQWVDSIDELGGNRRFDPDMTDETRINV